MDAILPNSVVLHVTNAIKHYDFWLHCSVEDLPIVSSPLVSIFLFPILQFSLHFRLSSLHFWSILFDLNTIFIRRHESIIKRFVQQRPHEYKEALEQSIYPSPWCIGGQQISLYLFNFTHYKLVQVCIELNSILYICISLAS